MELPAPLESCLDLAVDLVATGVVKQHMQSTEHLLFYSFVLFVAMTFKHIS